MTRFPPHLILEVTAHCNFRCPYCYCVWHEFPELADRELTTEEWTQILDECADNGVNDLLFTGGEALLRPDILELIRHARQRMPDAKLTLYTNASRLTEELILKLKELRTEISTSVQGLVTYAKMTGTRRTYARILRLLARAKELDWPMSVGITITSANRREAADLFCAVALSGAAAIQIGPTMAEGRARERLDLLLTRKEWETVKEEIRNLPDAGVPYSFCDEMICECRKQPAALRKRCADPAFQPCPAGKEFGVIGPNGLLRTCLHTVTASARSAQPPVTSC